MLSISTSAARNAPLSSPSLKHALAHGSLSSSGTSSSLCTRRLSLPHSKTTGLLHAPAMHHPATLPGVFSPPHYSPSNSPIQEGTIISYPTSTGEQLKNNLQFRRSGSQNLQLPSLASAGMMSPIIESPNFMEMAEAYARINHHSRHFEAELHRVGLGLSNLALTPLHPTIEESMETEQSMEVTGISDWQVSFESGAEEALKSCKGRKGTPFYQPHRKNSWLGW